MEKIFVTPTDPKTTVINIENEQPLSNEGEWVFPNIYWNRRANDGDVKIQTSKTKK